MAKSNFGTDASIWSNQNHAFSHIWVIPQKKCPQIQGTGLHYIYQDFVCQTNKYIFNKEKRKKNILVADLSVNGGGGGGEHL